MWWHPEHYNRKKDSLDIRSKVIKTIRRYFDDHDFMEVQTPALQVAPGMEPHLKAFQTTLLSADQSRTQELYLHTSPEFAMKKLLVAGLPRIYQICHCYRNAEGSSLHSPEFTMIEWYRAQAGYDNIMEDCVELLRSCAAQANIEKYQFRGNVADPFRDWHYLSVLEAFEKYAEMDIEPVLKDLHGFRTLAEKNGYRMAEDDSWEDIFFRVFLEEIEPNLGLGVPTILYDYPVSMAALSRPKPEDPRFAERFELYVCGMELANAFGELTDAEEQRQRYLRDMDMKEKLYGERWPIDEDFLAALEYGMPESSGIAMGVDRLVMLAANVDTIDDVLWTSKP